MANTRRIVWSNSAIAQKEATITRPAKSSATINYGAVEGTLEEVNLDKAAHTKNVSSVSSSSYTAYILEDVVGKNLGSKNTTDITYEQTTQEWTSFAHPKKYWEAYTDAGADSSDNSVLDDWDSVGHYWSNYLKLIGTTGVALSTQTDDLKFLYVKNLGAMHLSNNDYFVALAMDGSDYDIILAPGSAICIRGGSSVKCNVPKVKSGHSWLGVNIEFIVAK